MKGQAAIEYLTTYGWAILALVIVLAVLISTGIFSPSYLVSEECSFGNNLKCDAAVFNQGASTQVRMEVFNGFPYEVRLVSVRLQTQEGIAVSSLDADVNIPSGGKHLYEGVTSEQLPAGTMKRFVGNITYVSCAPELGPDCSDAEHTMTGRMTAKVLEE